MERQTEARGFCAGRRDDENFDRLVVVDRTSDADVQPAVGMTNAEEPVAAERRGGSDRRTPQSLPQDGRVRGGFISMSDLDAAKEKGFLVVKGEWPGNYLYIVVQGHDAEVDKRVRHFDYCGDAGFMG